MKPTNPLSGAVSAYSLFIVPAVLLLPQLHAADSSVSRTPAFRVADLDVNEAQQIELVDGMKPRIKLLSVDETRDPMRNAVRQARVKVELNGQSLVLTSATYHLPVTFGGVQID